MQESTSREKILKKVRNALIEKTKNPFPHLVNDHFLYHSNEEGAEIVFANQWISSGGHFIFCENKFDFAEQLLLLCEKEKWMNLVCPDLQLKDFLEDCQIPLGNPPVEIRDTETLLTTCECLVARTGSVLVSSRQAHGRRLPGIANNHIIIAYIDQLVDDIKDALQLMKNRYGNRLPSLMTLITGPSKTADIELIQVTGAHGPGAVFVFLIEKGSFD